MNTLPPKPVTTTLYRFYGADDQLLYVGISLSVLDRLGQHRGDKAWWTEIARSTMEHLPSREAAVAAELEAIRTEHPKYNVQGRQGPGPAAPTRVAPVTSKPEPPVGWFCLIDREDNGFALYGTENFSCSQGRVVSVAGDYLMVQLYSWLDGSPNYITPITVSRDGSNIRFYEDADEWRRAGDRATGQPHRGRGAT